MVTNEKKSFAHYLTEYGVFVLFIFLIKNIKESIYPEKLKRNKTSK